SARRRRCAGSESAWGARPGLCSPSLLRGRHGRGVRSPVSASARPAGSGRFGVLRQDDTRKGLSMTKETRTLDQLRQHYEVEKELAERLRSARKEDRARLYSQVYDELFRRVPLHPQLTRLLDHFLRPDTVFLEMGAGDCRLSLEVAKHVRKVYALDVSEEVHRGVQYPANFEFVLSRGTDIPIEPGNVTVAYSYQLMEHVHPDDAREQLTNIYQTLAPGGVYICITPNRLSGPHDISRYFDPVATGFHMREYTVTELDETFREAGFETVTVRAGLRDRFLELPVRAVSWLELLAGCLPRPARKALVQAPLMRNVLMAAVIGKKS